MGPLDPYEGDQLLRIANRQAAQQQRVNQAEDAGVQTDAEGERQDDHSAETGAAPQRAERVACVLQQLIDPDRNPHRARALLDERDVAECAERRGPRVVRRHPAVDVVLGFALEVIADVVVEIVEVTAALHAGRSTRVMARASVSHFVVSTSSCRRPLRVSR